MRDIKEMKRLLDLDEDELLNELVTKIIDETNPIKELVKALKQDKDYRRSWKDNIAMAYKDNYHWYKTKTGKKVMNTEDRHIIANNAAEYFIKLLCDEIKYPEGR